MTYLEQVFEHVVEHYANLALNPGWIDYARHQVSKMMKDDPEMWGELGQRVKKRLEEKKIESGIGLPASGTVSEPQKR